MILEDWEIDFHWLRIRNKVKDELGASKLPDMQAILFLIGIQEFGHFTSQRTFSKEEKQDLMHIAVCSLLEPDGYYEYSGRDHDGWPHWKTVIPFSTKGVEDQENYLKKKIIQYFDSRDNEEY